MKKIIYVIIGLIVVYIILCLFGPSQVKVERSTDINIPADFIKSKIVDLNFFQETWSPWTEKDPAMKVTFTGETGKQGNKMSWESDKKEVGKGSMTYQYTHGDTIMESLFFEGQGEAKIFHVITSNENSSKVTWSMQNSVPFFFRAMMLFMNIDKMVGPDFEKGLTKLKTALESSPATSTTGNYDIKELDWNEKTYYGIKTTGLSFDKIGSFLEQSYGKIEAVLSKAKVQPLSPPKAIYFEYNEKTMTTDLAAVLEVANGSKVQGLEKFELPPSKVLHIAYFGAYDKSEEAHKAIDNYMKQKSLTQSAVLEEYVTDPLIEKDTAKWQINIYYVIKK
jgi:effector-binding domain-containing protein